METRSPKEARTPKERTKSALSKLYFSSFYRFHVPDFPKIVMYHSVGSDDDLAVSRARFREQLTFLQQHYSIVDLPEAVGTTDRKTIALTFDDGLADFSDIAVPILREFDVPATTFVVSCSLQEGDGPSFPPPTMTADELRELADDPLITIGNHTQTHTGLTTLEPAEQREEIIGAKRVLEEELDIQVTRFAYPGGAFDENCVDIVRESHDFGVTVESPFRGEYTEYTLPRLHAHLPQPHFHWPLTSFSHLYHNLMSRKSPNLDYKNPASKA